MNFISVRTTILILICSLANPLSIASEGKNMTTAKLEDFLSDYTSDEKVISIDVEPSTIYIEKGRNAQFLNFDFLITGLSNKDLIIRFIKVAVYDSKNHLLTFRYINHNAVGTSGINTIGKTLIKGQEKLDIYNPFYEFPKELKIDHLRYMFTFFERETGKEFYYGNTIVRPKFYQQKAKLKIPLKGLITITDGHDFYSHHRRFAMSEVRNVTNNQFQSNFSRFALDFSLIGKDGNLRKMDLNENKMNYDFHFSDIKKFYTHQAEVLSPGDGEIVEVINDQEDMYNQPFDFDKAIKEQRIKDIAGNIVIIKHNDKEFSHLFHFKKGSIKVKIGEKVKRGEKLGEVGFSGTATLYSHLHYQLMNGKDFLKDEALPVQFDNVSILQGSKIKKFKTTTIDTGDFILN